MRDTFAPGRFPPEHVAFDVSELATSALVTEALLRPKPGLVDARDHKRSLGSDVALLPRATAVMPWKVRSPHRQSHPPVPSYALDPSQSHPIHIARSAAYFRAAPEWPAPAAKSRRERSTASSAVAFDSREARFTRPGRPHQPGGIDTMKKFNLLTAMAVVALTGGVFSGGAFAQTGTAVKESGKAVGEKVMEGKETAQAAVTSAPKKSAHKAKAKVHEDKASMHDSKAKAAGDQIAK